MYSPLSAMGGTEKFLAALMSALRDEFDFAVLFPVPNGFVLQTAWNVGTDALVEEEFLLPGGPKEVTGVDDELAAFENALAGK